MFLAHTPLPPTPRPHPQQCPSSTTWLWGITSTSTVLHSLCMQTFLFNVYLHIFKFLGWCLKYLPAHWSHCFCSCFPTFCLFQQLFYCFPLQLLVLFHGGAASGILRWRGPARGSAPCLEVCGRGRQEGSFHFKTPIWQSWGFPGGASGKEPACQRRRHKRRGFNPWDGKIPWRRAWQPTPVFLPGESHGQRSLAGCSPWGHTELDTTEVTQCAHAWQY